MNYKTVIIFFGVLLIYGTPAFTQTPASLQGRVVSETGEKIEFYTLVLLSAADSSVVSVDMFSNTEFRFGGIKPQRYILRVQDVQYQAYDTLITVREGANVLNAPLVLKPASLGEVVVKASRPVISHRHGNITVDVANSYLKDDISLESILGKLPGIIVDSKGGISMFGKDKLLIYINDMQTRSDEELKVLQSIDIDKIEVIRNVGAEYDADVEVVIKIKTRKRRDEKFHISLNDALYIRHYLYNSSGLSLYLGHNEKFSQYLTLIDGFGKSRNHHKSNIYTYFDDYINSNFRDDHDTYKSGRNELFYSLNYSISKDRELGVQYTGRFSENITQINGTRFYDDEISSKTVNIDSEEKYKINQSIINLNYKQKINTTGELSVVSDYVIRNRDETTYIKESAIDWKANNIINGDNDGRVFSMTSAYKITGRKFRYTTGLKYSHLKNRSVTEFRPSTNVSHTQLFEHTGGAYMIFDADLSFVNIKSGVRMEYTNSVIQSDDESNNLDRKYFNLIPHISINSKLNGHLNLTAYYKRTLQRPAIGNLSSTVVYWDSLMYKTGNPRLKPEITDEFSLNAVFCKFNFILGYRIYRDQISYDCIPDASNPNRTINTYANMKGKYNELTFGISYSFNHPVFTNMTSLNYKKQLNLSMPFRNDIIRFRKAGYYFQTSGNINILKNTNLDYSFFYNNVGDKGYMRYNKPYSNFSLTLTQYLINRKVMFSFSVEDIFNKNKNNRWTEYYNGNITYTQDSLTPDSRYVIFRIRYNWGKSKSIQKKMSDTDHIRRL
jgi:hypothetical protein